MNEERPIRIGDQEREDAVKRLGAHYEAGRLTADEHQERVGDALQAKTEADLKALFADLPEESKAQEVPKGPSAQRGKPWERAPFQRIPLPLLLALAAVGVLASIGCVVGGGHPPVLPLLLILAGVVIYKKRREQRA